MKIILPNSLDEIQKWVASKIEKRKEFRICGQGTRFVDSNLKNSKLISNEFLSLKNLDA